VRGSTSLRLLPAILLVLALVIPTTGAMAAPAYQSFAMRTVIVGLGPGAGPSGVVANDVARQLGGQRGFVYSHAFNGFTITLPEQLIPVLERDPRISFVEADQMVQAFDLPTGVDRVEADKYHSTASGGSPATFSVAVDVAVLDTGIASHPDLNVVGAVDCTFTNFWGQASCLSRANSDGNGHGTHVAGTIGGRANGGAVGVAPGARLWSVKVLNANGSGSMSSVIAGIDWVTARAGSISVANMSLGCNCTSQALNTAINNSTNSGIVFISAAGNSGVNASNFSPANHPRVITVSAMADFDGKPGGVGQPTCRQETDDSFASFSNFGNVVSIAAPGVCILSTWPGGGYAVLSGTSMASPHVAGAAALYIAANNVPRNSQRWSVVKSGLLSAEWSVPQSHECGFSGGRSNERSLMLADCSESAGDPPPANTPPTAEISNPTAGSTVQGTVTIQVSASDNQDADGTLDVQVRIGSGSWQNTTYSNGLYSFAWDTTTVSNGSQTINARATDSANATTNATAVTVNVNNPPPPTNNPPTAIIASPTPGATLQGSVSIHVDASDNEDADDSLTVQIRIGAGSWQNATYSSGLYRWTWDTTTVGNGSHTIHARATDSANATTNATSVSVNVNNPPANTAPSASIVSPTSGSTVQGSVSIQVNASDNQDAAGTLNVQVRIGNGSWQNATYSSGAYRWTWDTTSVVNGSHTISARATDSGGLTTNATSVQVNVNNPVATTTMHIGAMNGSSQRVSTFSWRANVTIRIVDSGGGNVSNATVQGRWSTGSVVSCVTSSNGQCTVSLSGLSTLFNRSVSFGVIDVMHSTLSYNASDNVVSSITVLR